MSEYVKIKRRLYDELVETKAKYAVLCEMIEALKRSMKITGRRGKRMSNDTISRQAAIDVPYRVDEYNARSVEAIKKLPSAEKVGEWIPVSERLPDGERLPDENADILVTYVNGEETRIIPVNYYQGTWFDCIFDVKLDPLKITAWMPLPKPWKGEEG